MKKYLKISIIILMVLMLGYIFTNTYSKYINNASARIEQDVGRWNIKVNDVDITSTTGEPVEFEIDNFLWNETNHVKEGKVAPGMKGQFDLSIDPKDTDVSIKYSIKIDNTKLTESNDINLKIKKIILNGTEYEFTATPVTEEVDDGNGGTTEVTTTIIEVSIIKTLSAVQSTDPSVRIDNMKVEVEWENNETYNTKDSEIGSVPGNVIVLPISIDVIQYTGEEPEEPEEPEPSEPEEP